MIVGEKKR